MKTTLVHQLIRDVFDPHPEERVLLLTDLPSQTCRDHEAWHDRRAMAAEWLDAFKQLGLRSAALIRYPATGKPNAPLPIAGHCARRPVVLHEVLQAADLVVAMTEFSATAPLSMLPGVSRGRLRVASMPGVLRRMLDSALAADYPDIARKAACLAGQLTLAEGAEVCFDSGDTVFFDLRFRCGVADGGLCRRGRPHTVINLPGGEAFSAPYEGERPGIPSRTAGRIPAAHAGTRCTLIVEQNRIIAVDGDTPAAAHFDRLFAGDPAVRNVAELGLGCNDRAVVLGATLEDEKAGMHWAFGRSEHLGGTVGPEAFAAPEHILHQDLVYARGCPIEAVTIMLILPAGRRIPLMEQGEYCWPQS